MKLELQINPKARRLNSFEIFRMCVEGEEEEVVAIPSILGGFSSLAIRHHYNHVYVYVIRVSQEFDPLSGLPPSVCLFVRLFFRASVQPTNVFWGRLPLFPGKRKEKR